MIRIGDFARLGQVSVVTLRYYDEIGLLRPEKVDPLTGYRYYAVGQLPRLNRILALKELDFSLEQIELTLNANLSPDQMRAMLRSKRDEVAQRISAEQRRLVQIDARLRQIELEELMPEFDVVLKTAPAMRVASRRVVIPTNDEVPKYLNPAFSEAAGYVKSQGAKETGPCLALWHSTADTYVDEEAEAMVQIGAALPGTDRVKVYELPPALVASVVHQGSFEAFKQIHITLLRWIEANGYRVVGGYREIYIETKPGQPTTEIQYPVEKI